ncbi:MAG: dihydrofolate reductase [Azoarcus sp.]|jgi:dihydrofolate reductase|nr:dihydrofolate reductase [Azoarcus sp.]
MNALPRREIILIAAVARNGVIGRDNALPWRLKADLARFRTVTMGHPILMGRKTWESLKKPLPGRRNLVLTRQSAYRAQGAEVFASVDEALDTLKRDERIFVIGGAEIYRILLQKADILLLSEVDADVAGDARFPDFDRTLFKEVSRTTHPADADNEYAFDFVEYRRIPSH